MMKLFFKWAALLGLLLPRCLFGRLSPNPGSFGFDVEWLYFRPAVDSPFFVLQGLDSFEPPIGGRRANEFHYQSGYRIEAAYAFCNQMNDFRARFSSLQLEGNKKTVRGNRLWPTIGSPAEENFGTLLAYDGFARGESKINYYAVDALLGQKLFCGMPFDLSLEGGVQYAHVFYQQSGFYQSLLPSAISALAKNTSKFWGIGPELGVDFGYAFCGGFGLTGRAIGSLLISKMRGEAFFDDGQFTRPLTDTANERFWRVVPSYDLRFGLTYGSCLCCMNFNVEVGYEALHYSKALNMFYFPNGSIEGNSAYSFDNYSDLSFHGPYVQFAISF